MNLSRSLGKKLSYSELSFFCGQLAAVLEAGMSVQEGLEIMKEDSGKQSECKLLDYLIDRLSDNESFGIALKDSGLFPDYVVNMVSVGEETGTMDEVMKSLSAHYAREDSISRTIRSSITFPLIMIGMMIVVIVVLLTVVLPIFNRVFMQLGSEMSGISRVLLSAGNAINRYSIVFIIIALLLAAAVLLGIFTQKGRKILTGLGSSFPGIRKIRDERTVGRIASVLSLSLGCGITAERGIELAAKACDDPDYKKRLEDVSERNKNGEELSKALSSSGIFHGMQSRLSLIGEKTGSLDKALSDISKASREEVDRRIDRIIAVLEPSLVVILSVIVGLILLSVMLPLLGIMSGM